MSTTTSSGTPKGSERGGLPGAVLSAWPVVVPLVTFAAMLASWGRQLSGAAVAVLAVLLIATVLAAVHHAEVVARRVGSVLGTLILALSVTFIESGLIITVMTTGGAATATLARDSVFAAVILCCNGVIGLSIVLATWRRRIAVFSANVTGAGFATVGTVAALSMVLPTFTTSTPGPTFTGVQLAFAAVASLLLYVLYSATSTIWQRKDLQPEHVDPSHPAHRQAEPEPERPSCRRAVASLVLLLVALTAAVGTGEVLAPTVEHAIAVLGLPAAAVGVVIALLVLMPETLTAAMAARKGHVQTSMNLALGSAMASAGLTIPVVAVASVFLHISLHLGLGAKEMVLLALTVMVGTLTVVPGRASLLRGVVHLTIAAAFVFLAAFP